MIYGFKINLTFNITTTKKKKVGKATERVHDILKQQVTFFKG